MPCLIGCLAMFAPRIAIVLVAFFSDYLLRAFDSGCWICLGFVFLPTTTLAYAWAKNSGGGVEGLELVIVVVAALIDCGLVGGGAHQARRGWEDDD